MQPSDKPRARRRSKPSFEIPPDAAAPPVAGWAYRTEAAPPAPPAVAPPAAAGPQPAVPPPIQSTSGALTGGAEILALGFTLAGRMSLAALALFGAPLGFARRILGGAPAVRRGTKSD